MAGGQGFQNQNQQIGFNAQPQGYQQQPQGYQQPQNNYQPNTVQINVQSNVNSGQYMNYDPQYFRQGNNFGPDPITATKNILYHARSVYIMQQVNLFEVVTGCDMKNRYEVFVKFDGGNFIRLFRCKEESDWFMRNCCHGDARAFKMKFMFVGNLMDLNQFDESSGITVGWMDRPFKCTCCCLDRPELSVFWGDYMNMSNALGKVKEPCTLINPVMLMDDLQNVTRWKIEADGCQAGICCRGNIIGKMSEVSFPIFSGEKQDTLQSDGAIVRRFPGCGKALITDSDNFEIFFPVNASPDDKLMMISTALMIDYRYYCEDPDDNFDINIAI